MEFTKTFSTLFNITSSPSDGTLLLSQLAGLLKLVFGSHFLMEAEHWWTKRTKSKYEIPFTLDLPCNLEEMSQDFKQYMDVKEVWWHWMNHER